MGANAVSCRRAYEHDLPGFLVDPRAPEHAEFRDHYPRCAACAAEVRAWSELATALAAAAPGHPAPERLLRLADARAALAPDERAALERHLAGCAACRDELASLARFDPALLAARAPEREAGAGSWLAALRRALWHPAFAYALLLVLALPTVYTLVRPEPREDRAPAPAREAGAGDEAEALAMLREAEPGRAAASPERARLAARDEVAPQPEAGAAVTAPAPEQAETFTAQAAVPSAGAPAEAEALRSFPASDARELAAADARAVEAAPLPAAPAEAAGPAPLRFERRAGGLAALRLPVEPGAGEREVRLVAPDGRSLVQRLAPQAGALELLVTESWLGAGPHLVEIRGPDGPTTLTALPPP
jgi:hypothetical protein